MAHRIDTTGATVGNLFTEGNPTLGVPATVVGADWLNDTVQEEVCGVVEAAGLTLSKPDNTQLLQALNILIAGGGSSQISQAITNNSGPNSITGLLLDNSTHVGMVFEFDMHRQTDTQNIQAMGAAYVKYDPADAAYRIAVQSFFDESGAQPAGVEFTVTGTGQIQYTSDDLTGANYSGTLRVLNARKFLS